MYELVPGISYFRRPADAVFLIGALGSIVAGYVLHRILLQPPWEKWTGDILTTVGTMAGLLLACLLVARWRDRVGPATGPLLLAARKLCCGVRSGGGRALAEDHSGRSRRWR